MPGLGLSGMKAFIGVCVLWSRWLIRETRSDLESFVGSSGGFIKTGVVDLGFRFSDMLTFIHDSD